MNLESYSDAVCVAQILGDRETQQDDFGCLIADEFTLLVIADGMGGHQAGEEASQIVVENFLTPIESLEQGYQLSQRELALSLSRANEDIADVIASSPQKSGMGSTVVAVLKDHHCLQWLSVGDSHLYRLRDGQLEKLNADHSMMPLILEMVASGKLEQQEIDSHPLRNNLRSAIAGGRIELIDYPERPVRHSVGDLYLLGTDGLDALSFASLAEVLNDNQEKLPIDICKALLDAVTAEDVEGRDNTTFDILKI